MVVAYILGAFTVRKYALHIKLNKIWAIQSFRNIAENDDIGFVF